MYSSNSRGDGAAIGSSGRERSLIERLESRLLFATVPSGFVDTRVTGNLDVPTAIEAAPDGRVFVTEKDGRVRIVKNGALLPTPFVSLSGVSTTGERGLVGITFDPNFATNKYVYLNYTATSPVVHNRVMRVTANGDVAVAGSETTIFDLPSTGDARFHMAGAIHFGPDGKLYVAVGDHESLSSPQSLSSLKGKILRLNASGSIPSDNPFYSSASGNNRAIWAYGLRNPYTTAFQKGTGRFYINDVGAGDWEEINAGKAGANYGWSIKEGMTSDTRFTNPVYTYSHSVGQSIIGGAFYTGVAQQFPSQYKDKYFFADYVGNWVRTFDPSTKAVGTFATGLRSPTGLTVSPDGSIWYISRGAGSGQTADDIGSINRIRYTLSQGPQITDEPDDVRARAGDEVTFAVSATGPGTLRYQWQRNGIDIAGATARTYTRTAAAGDDGAAFRVIVSNEFGGATSRGAVLVVGVGDAPTATIVTPAAGATSAGGQAFQFSGTAADAEDGTLGAAAFSWRVDFHHEAHTHPFVATTRGVTGGSFTIPTTGETSANVFYRVHLTVTDSEGLTASTYRDVVPRKATVTLDTEPAGLSLRLDGKSVVAPAAVEGVIGIGRTLEAPASQVLNGVAYEFAGWSDGATAATRTFAFPAEPTSYVATYRATSVVYLSDLTPAGTPINGKGPIERDRANGGSAAGDGTPLKLAGVTYEKGIGTWAESTIVYDLGGRYSRFLADVGIDDVVGSGGTVVFRVYANDVKIYDSGKRTGSSPTRSLDLDVTGKSTLKLRVTNYDGNITGDSADWAAARLIAASPPVAPPAPADLRAAAVSSSQIDLSWSAPAGAAVTGYRVERSTAGGPFAEGGTLAGSARSFANTRLAASTADADPGGARNAGRPSPAAEASAMTRAAAATSQAEDAAAVGPDRHRAQVRVHRHGVRRLRHVHRRVRRVGRDRRHCRHLPARLPLRPRRHARAHARPARQRHDPRAAFSFAPTGSWTTWRTASIDVTLAAGANKIRLTTTGTNGPNLDSLIVR